MTDGFESEKRRRRHAVDPSLGYWLGPSTASQDCLLAPIHCQTPIPPHNAPVVDFNLASAAERPLKLDEGPMVVDRFSHNLQINDSGGVFSGNPPWHSTVPIIDEECIKILDRPSLLPSPCDGKAPSILPSPPAVHGALSQKNDNITVEQFLRMQSGARLPAKRGNYKRRPKVTVKSDLERLKEADSSFLREEDELLSDNGDDTLALPTRRRRKTQLTSQYQTARKRRRTRKGKEDTNVVQPLELQDEPLPNIATRSLHEHWHPVDPRKGRPFLQPTFVNGRHRISLGPLKPAPVPPLKRAKIDLFDGFYDRQDLPLTKRASWKKTCPSARMTLSMEPTEDHERKLKSWKSNNVQDLSLKQLQLISNDPAGASHPVHSPRVDSRTRLTVPRRNLLGHVTSHNTTPSASKGALHPTEAPSPTAYAEVASKHPASPLHTAIIDQGDQGDQSVVLVEDSFLDVDEPEHVSRPPTAYPPQKLVHLSDILGALLKTAREIKH